MQSFWAECIISLPFVVFTTSFGPGGFRTTRIHTTRGRPTQEQQQQSATPRSHFVQLIPLLILFGFSLLSALPNLLSTPPVPDPRLSGRCSHLVYSITRFDSSGGIFPTQPSSPAVMITFEGSAPHPKIIVPDVLKASPSPGPPSPVPPVWHNASPMFAPLAPQPFLSRPLRSTPSLGTLTPPIPHGVSRHRDDDGVWCHLCRSTGTD